MGLRKKVPRSGRRLSQKKKEMIGENIRHYREGKFPGRGGATRCAEAFGVSPQQWSLWEKGTRTPDEKHIQEIADLFDVPVECLLRDRFFNKCSIHRDLVGGIAASFTLDSHALYEGSTVAIDTHRELDNRTVKLVECMVDEGLRLFNKSLLEGYTIQFLMVLPDSKKHPLPRQHRPSDAERKNHTTEPGFEGNSEGMEAYHTPPRRRLAEAREPRVAI